MNEQNWEYSKLEENDPRLSVTIPVLDNLKINFDHSYIDRYVNPEYWYSEQAGRFSYPHALQTMFNALRDLLNAGEPVELTMSQEECSAFFNIIFSAMISKGLIPQSQQKLGGILDELMVGPVVNDFVGDEETDKQVLTDLIDNYFQAWGGTTNYNDPG
tara:strand:+ start:97 stop:573 length:477 start_codon:yes stop_codon:yes gene_type:complete